MAQNVLIRLRWWIAGVALACAAAYLLVVWPLRDPHPTPQRARGVLAIRDVKIYTTPDAVPVEHGTVVVRDGLIVAAAAGAAVPEGARVLECPGCTITAGFWNAHVHFTEPKWQRAPWGPAATLGEQLKDMLTSRGFTTVVDAGSDPRVSISLRRRIETGGIAGPAIYTAGAALYPPQGVPYYLKSTLPFWMIWLMPQPESAAEGARVAERNFAIGTDLLKLFTGSWVTQGKVKPMPVEIARAAAEAGHRHGQLVFSHPSDLAGTMVAVESGVDVLAHAPDSTGGIDAALLGRIVEKHMAMIPTLKMLATTVTKDPAYLQPIYGIVRQFHALGGELLFGTDVGYMTDYSTDDEFRALAGCGLNARDILRMLTVAPAGRFGVAGERGTIAPGRQADLVLVDGDPDRDTAAFARVRYTIRNGRVLYQKP